MLNVMLRIMKKCVLKLMGFFQVVKTPLKCMCNKIVTTTVVSLYNDTPRMRKIYSIDYRNIDYPATRTSIHLYSLLMARTLILYRNDQYFDVSNLVIIRDDCTPNS